MPKARRNTENHPAPEKVEELTEEQLGRIEELYYSLKSLEDSSRDERLRYGQFAGPHGVVCAGCASSTF